MIGRVAAYARFETVGFLRNGEQLLVSIVLPALALLAVGVADLVELPASPGWAEVARIDVITPGVLALAIISSSFTSLAISTAFDRRWGVLRQLATTPLGSRGIVAGKVVATFAVQTLQVAALSAFAFVLGWRPDAGGLSWATLAWLVGSLCFTGFGLLLAARLRAEAVLALANLLWILLAASGVVLPLGGAGAFSWLPGSLLGDLMRVALIDGALDLAPALALTAWAGLTLALAARLFRPSE